MNISIASGKGGTGKTMISVSLADILGPDSVLIDLDVEEPNAGLYFVKALEKSQTVHRMIPVFDYERCTFCGICVNVCAFNALFMLPSEIMAFPELCHSCLSCFYNCPQAAISEGKHAIGNIDEHLLANGVPLITGCLMVGEAQSPPLIKAAKQAALPYKSMRAILDCPPGVGCSTLEAIRGSDYCILVTEPTPFGYHDLRSALEAVNLLDIPAGIIINRWRGADAGIDTLANQYRVPVLARIPFNKALAVAFAEGRPPITAMPELKGILEGVISELQVNVS